MKNITLIDNKKALKDLTAAGFIQWPVDKGHCYVKRGENHSVNGFELKGVKYFTKFVDGCFYEFVFTK